MFTLPDRRRPPRTRPAPDPAAPPPRWRPSTPCLRAGPLAFYPDAAALAAADRAAAEEWDRRLHAEPDRQEADRIVRSRLNPTTLTVDLRGAAEARAKALLAAAPQAAAAALAAGRDRAEAAVREAAGDLPGRLLRAARTREELHRLRHGKTPPAFEACAVLADPAGLLYAEANDPEAAAALDRQAADEARRLHEEALAATRATCPAFCEWEQRVAEGWGGTGLAEDSRQAAEPQLNAALDAPAEALRAEHAACASALAAALAGPLARWLLLDRCTRLGPAA